MWPGKFAENSQPGNCAHERMGASRDDRDGSGRKRPGTHIYINGKLAPIEIIRDGLYKDITYEGGEPDLAIGYRFRDSGFKEGLVDEFNVFARVLSPLEIAQLAGASELIDLWNTLPEVLSEEMRARLFDYYVSQVFLHPPIEMTPVLWRIRCERNAAISQERAFRKVRW